MRVANGFGNVAVAAGLTVWNFEQCAPTRDLEVGSAEIKRKRKLAALAHEVIIEFAEVGREGWFGLAQLGQTGIHFHHAVFKFEPHQTLRGSGKEERTNGRGRTSVEKSFHDALEDSTISEA